MSRGTRSRLLRGFGATVVGPVVTLVVQLVNVPLFLSFWGPRLYGEWLVLSAIPSYLALSDMGFGNVAGTEMTIQVAKGDRSAALKTFQSVWLFISLLSVAAALLVLALIFSCPVDAVFRIQTMPLSDVRMVLAFLSLFALATLQATLLTAAFQSDGQYALGILSLNVLRIVENLSVILLVINHASPVTVAAALLVARVVGTTSIGLLLCYKLPWLRFGYRAADVRSIKAITRPAIAFMAFPAGNALSIQGMTVLVGHLLGPIAVATFNPMRTMSRLVFQIVDSIKNAVWPELSSACGTENWGLGRRLHRSSCQIGFWVALLAVGCLGIVGPSVFRVWTRGRVEIDLTCFYLLLAVVVVNALWNTSSAVSIAVNKHERTALQYLCATASALVLGRLIVPYLHLTGAALSLLWVDSWMAVFVVRDSTRIVKDTTSEFFWAMLNPKQLVGQLVRK